MASCLHNRDGEGVEGGGFSDPLISYDVRLFITSVGEGCVVCICREKLNKKYIWWGEKKVSENTHYSLKAEKLFDELHVCPRRRASRVFP